MYEAPILLIERQMQANIENEVLSRITQEIYVDINKEELIKALMYDRDQYDKGYMDGVKEFAEKVKSEIPIILNAKDGATMLIVLDAIVEEMGG